MFMSQDPSENSGELLQEPKKTEKKSAKSKVKAKAKKTVAKKVAKVKAPKAAIKKAKNPKVGKPKAYKVSGTFKLDAAGKLVKKTKAIDLVKIHKAKNLIVVTFVLKKK
jgi:uncharacterized Rmd1/YagE family protein